MSSSDPQRTQPRNELQRRLSSSSPPAPENGANAGSEPPEWRGERFAELVAAEIREFSKPEWGSKRRARRANASSRAVSESVPGLAAASTVRLSAADARGTLTAALAACMAVPRAIVRMLDLIGGGVIALLRSLGHALPHRRALLLALVTLLFAAGAFSAATSYAPAGTRALTAGSSRGQAALLEFGAGLHRALVDVGLAEPLPEAAASLEP